MPLLSSLEDTRDVVIIVYGILGSILFFVAIVAAVVLFWMARRILSTVKALLDDNVKPALGSIREAADTVRGTTDFIGRTAVSPIARTYGVFAGVRKGLGVLGGLNRGRRR